MSESRQRITGRLCVGFLVLAFLWLLLVTLPLFTSYLQISTMDPRWMTPEDLTWKRMVFNVLSKPGFQTVLIGLLGGVMTLVGWRMSDAWGKKKKSVQMWPHRPSFSLEWVIDGSRKSSIIEYGRFVGVI
jgi:hypothetical protein